MILVAYELLILMVIARSRLGGSATVMSSTQLPCLAAECSVDINCRHLIPSGAADANIELSMMKLMSQRMRHIPSLSRCTRTLLHRRHSELT
ncbi:hypothetical protein PILCRDRAFT_106585 [Piloderma croceum F 1598]|uniref:Secreted protein n=1 Tax=Piloderma croceum (strain F 1598) TaxID=765440 RepID=A0A0C3G6V5_PILCF|nr:hypothetical protein PILCRDRAFT_106585 [Piloderma croceum F 1598]